MNHMIRCVGKPYFSLPCNIIHVFLEFFRIREGRHIYDSIRAILSKLFQLNNTLCGNRSVRSYHLNEE